jgi:hypothetical protein
VTRFSLLVPFFPERAPELMLVVIYGLEGGSPFSGVLKEKEISGEAMTD